MPYLNEYLWLHSTDFEGPPLKVCAPQLYQRLFPVVVKIDIFFRIFIIYKYAHFLSTLSIIQFIIVFYINLLIFIVIKVL